MKGSRVLIIFLLVIVLLLGLFLIFRYSEPKLIGGQTDEHGCLIPAGYSWCGAKEKCLRTWEEKCESEKKVVEKPSDTITYQNTKYGFELELPKTWEGYKVTEGEYPSYTYVGFSFSGDRQPFTIFQLVRYAGSDKFVCDGCCKEDGDATGGGQFDAFQIARCEEVPTIMKSYKLTESTVPLPQETDMIRTFFNLIDEGKPSEAVLMMSPKITSDDRRKQAWAVQFNAVEKMEVEDIIPSHQADWTETEHLYMVRMQVEMNPNAVNAPIPNYGWHNGKNTRWVQLLKINEKWFINGIGTGP